MIVSDELKMNIVSDYRTCSYNMDELSLKHGISRSTIRSVISKELSDVEYESIKLNVYRGNRCSQSLDVRNSIVLDYKSGRYSIYDLSIKYSVSYNTIYNIILQMVPAVDRNKIEFDTKRLNFGERQKFLKSNESDIISDFKTKNFTFCDLERKYFVSSETIRSLVHRVLSDDIVVEIISSYHGKSAVGFYEDIIADYKTCSYYQYELAFKYDISSSTISKILCSYLDDAVRLDIFNFQYNRDYGGSVQSWRRYGIIGSVYSDKCKRTMYCRSDMERKAIYILEGDDSVLDYRYESLRIRYNGSRLYIPDFVVKYVDGRTLVLEIKPCSQLDLDINICKFESAKKYCVEHGMEFVIWTEEDLKISSL